MYVELIYERTCPNISAARTRLMQAFHHAHIPPAWTEWEISILDMQDPTVAERARTLGVTSVPAVAIDGQLAECCARRGVDKDSLLRSGIGQPLS